MLRILTAFDHTKPRVLPLRSIVIGEDIKFYTFYAPGSKLTIRQIEQEIEQFKQLFNQPCIVNDFKSHVAAFNLHRNVLYEVNNIYVDIDDFTPKGLATAAKNIIDMDVSKWQNLQAKASVVYQVLEDRGLYNGHLKVNPKYNLNNFTGRSSTSVFNVQGTTSNFNILPVYGENMVFVNFDWIAADLRMAAHMSNDKCMIDAYNSSDPYTAISEYFKTISRSEAKAAFFKAFYSMSLDAPIIDPFPQFRDWAKTKADELEQNNCLYSIMGRKFSNGNKLSIFNAQFQGSVAHAMQAALVKIFEIYPANIVTEVHDSIIMFGTPDCVKTIIRNVVPIMLNPLSGWVDNPPRMQFEVSVGNRWRDWQKLRVYR